MGTNKNLMRNIQPQNRLGVGILILLISLLVFACDEAGGKDSSTNDNTSSETRAALEDSYCAALCDAHSACEGDGDVDCHNDCLLQAAPLLNSDYLIASGACWEDYICGTSDDSCYSAVITEYIDEEDLLSDSVYLNCSQQSDSCGFLDDICITYFQLADGLQSELNDCFELSECSDVNQCLAEFESTYFE